MENLPRAIEDVHLAHAGAFHRGVQRNKVAFDEFDQIERIVFYCGPGFA